MRSPGARREGPWGRRARVVVAPLLAFCAAGREARAQTRASVRLSIVRAVGAESCPETASVARAVTARLGAESVAPDASRSIEVLFSRERGWRAQILAREFDGAPAALRVLHSATPTCASLAASVALAVALAIDPDAPSRPVAVAPPAPPEVPLVAPACPVCATCAVCPRPVSVAPPPPGLQGAVSARGGVVAGLLPSAAPWVALRVVVAPTWRWHAALGVMVVPEVRARDGAFGFGLTALTAGVCFGVAQTRLRAALCAEALVGAMHATVRGLSPVDANDRLWVGLHPEADLRLSLSRAAFVELGAGMMVGVASWRYRVEGRTEPVFDPPPVAFEGHAGVGVDFR